MTVTAFLVLSKWVLLTWPLTGMTIMILKLLGGQGHPALEPLRFMFCELKPFYLPALAAYPMLLVLHGGRPTSLWDAMFIGFAVINWFSYRNDDDDDDRWKRRLRKVAERIERSGARLVVVPAGGER